MPLPFEPEPPSLRVDAGGAVRVGPTRVLFVLVVEAFRDGATPEEIVMMYDTLDLADAYAACAYYLRHKAAVDEFVAEYHRAGDELREKIEARQGSRAGVRERLLARKAATDAGRPWPDIPLFPLAPAGGSQ